MTLVIDVVKRSTKPLLLLLRKILPDLEHEIIRYSITFDAPDKFKKWSFRLSLIRKDPKSVKLLLIITEASLK